MPKIELHDDDVKSIKSFTDSVKEKLPDLDQDCPDIPSEEPIHLRSHNFIDGIDEHLDGLTFRSEDGQGPEFDEFKRN